MGWAQRLERMQFVMGNGNTFITQNTLHNYLILKLIRMKFMTLVKILTTKIFLRNAI